MSAAIPGKFVFDTQAETWSATVGPVNMSLGCVSLSAYVEKHSAGEAACNGLGTQLDVDMSVACGAVSAAGHGHGSKRCDVVKHKNPPANISATKEEAEAYCEGLGQSWAILAQPGGWGIVEGVVFCGHMMDALGRPTNELRDGYERASIGDSIYGAEVAAGDFGCFFLFLTA